MNTVSSGVYVTSENQAQVTHDVNNEVHSDPVGKREEHGGEEHRAVAV